MHQRTNQDETKKKTIITGITFLFIRAKHFQICCGEFCQQHEQKKTAITELKNKMVIT